MTPDKIYFDFIRCEDQSADLYLDLSVHFCDEIDLSWFWVDMAMDEKQRAGLIHYCLENRVFAQDLPSPIAIQSLEQQLEGLRWRASDPTLSLDGAFDIAIQVETSEIDDICSRLTMPLQAPSHILRKKLDLSGPTCCRKLRSAAERFAISPAVRSRLVGLP